MMILRYALFFAVALTLVVAGHVYLYRRLVRDTVADARWRRAGLILTGVLAALLVGGRVLQRSWDSPVAEAIGAVSFIWMGVALFLVLCLLAVGAARRLQGLLTRRRAAATAEVDPERRRVLARAVAGSAAAVATAASGYGMWRAYTAPEVTELAVHLPRLPQALDGLSIVQLTDIHVGNIIERRFLDDLVQRANALRPDLVAITGDLVDGGVRELGHAVSALGGLRSRYGTFFVTGNHEYYSGDVPWTSFLEGLGVNVLRNRRVSIGDAGASIDLLGVDDWSRRDRARGYDLDRATAGRDPDRAAVLLAHQPSNFEAAAAMGVGLQLSGHTHGGQLFPFTLFVDLAWPYSAGHYRHQDAHIYVSRGCGFWGPPMRVGSPPELVKLTLTARGKTG